MGKINKSYLALRNGYINQEYVIKANFQNSSKQMGQILIITFFMIHIVSCQFLFIVYAEDFNDQTWVYHKQVQDDSKFQQYVVAYYWAVQSVSTVGLGDVSITTKIEKIFTIFVVIVGAGYYSYIVGLIANLFASQGTKDSYITYQKTIMDEFCDQTNISKDVKLQIQSAIQFNADISIFNQQEKNFLILQLPSQTKQQVFQIYSKLSQNIFRGLQNQVFLKNKNQLFITEAILMMVPIKVQKGDLIYQQNRYPNAIYFIVQGQVSCENQDNAIFKNYVENSYFGEIEIIKNNQQNQIIFYIIYIKIILIKFLDFEIIILINHTLINIINQINAINIQRIMDKKFYCLRLFSTRSKIETDLLTINEQDFLRLMSMFPNYYQEIKNLALQREYFLQYSLKKVKKISKMKPNFQFWNENKNQTLYQQMQDDNKNLQKNNLKKSMENQNQKIDEYFKDEELEDQLNYNDQDFTSKLNKTQIQSEIVFIEHFFKKQAENQNKHIKNLEFILQEQKQTSDLMFQKIDDIYDQIVELKTHFDNQFHAISSQDFSN